MRDSVPSARYSSVCNVLHQWRIWLIPTYRVYRLYDMYGSVILPYIHVYNYIYICIYGLVMLPYICSTQSENLRDLQIALRNLRILRTEANLQIACAICRLRNNAQSENLRDLQIALRNLRILRTEANLQIACAICRLRNNARARSEDAGGTAVL